MVAVELGKNSQFRGLVFLFMFFAVTCFGLRVISYTKEQRVLNNITYNLVADLHNTKKRAIETGKRITLKAVQPRSLNLIDSSDKSPFAYVIIQGLDVEEEIVLPRGITVSGIVTFNPDGTPEKPSSFVLSQDKRTATVEIDKGGLVSVP